MNGNEAAQGAPKPDPLPVNADCIPRELRELPRWVLWRYDSRDGHNGSPVRWEKLPCRVNGKPARSNDPATWNEFKGVQAEYLRGGWSGVGFMLGTPYVGIDLDGVFDPETGCYLSWPRSFAVKFAKPDAVPDPGEIIFRLATYAEISPSRSGVKAIVRGTLPEGRRKIGGKGLVAGLEMYDGGRFFTLTGHLAPGGQTTITDANGFIAELHGAVFGRHKGAVANHPPIGRNPSDDEIRAALGRARNKGKVERLLSGDASGYGSPSEADAALASHLAFYTRDVDQIARLMRESRLNRDKYDRPDYLPRTIGRALKEVTDTYKWSCAIEKHREGIEKGGEGERRTECDSGSPEAAIRLAVPDAPGPLNRLVFGLARALKAVPELADAPGDAAEEYVRQWHRLSTEAGIIDASFDDCRIAFLQRWNKVRFPLGEGPMNIILEKAQAAALPKCGERYDSEPLRLLVRLCRALQQEAKDSPFFLSCATAGRVLGVDSATASRYLWLLRRDGVLEEVEKGEIRTRRASRFRYRGD